MLRQRLSRASPRPSLGSRSAAHLAAHSPPVPTLQLKGNANAIMHTVPNSTKAQLTEGIAASRSAPRRSWVRVSPVAMAVCGPSGAKSRPIAPSQHTTKSRSKRLYMHYATELPKPPRHAGVPHTMQPNCDSAAAVLRYRQSPLSIPQCIKTPVAIFPFSHTPLVQAHVGMGIA